MRSPLRALALASLSLVATVAPTAAQDFLRTSASTIPADVFELSTCPTLLFGRSGGPDRLGVAGWVGYGITDSLDVTGKLAAFDGFALLGLDAGFWFLRGPIDMLVDLGAHKALIQDARDTSSFDVAWLAARRVNRRLAVSGGVSASFESIDGTTDSGFTRVYVGPGLRYRLSERVDLTSQVGIGITRHSPSYFTLGLAAYLPASGSVPRREPR